MSDAVGTELIKWGEALMADMEFVRQVADRTYGDGRRAETLIFAVFQELRDRLTPNEAGDVASITDSAISIDGARTQVTA
jgi:uncharacterized protein (DUF2267 family)